MIVGLQSGHHLRRWPGIKPTMAQRLMFCWGGRIKQPSGNTPSVWFEEVNIALSCNISAPGVYILIWTLKWWHWLNFREKKFYEGMQNTRDWNTRNICV